MAVIAVAIGWNGDRDNGQISINRIFSESREVKKQRRPLS